MALCVWWPGFELELERLRTPRLAERPLALPDTVSGSRRAIDLACERAHAEGVRPGMLVSQAIALCSTLVLLEPDPDFYDAARERLAEALGRWCPILERSADRGRFFLGVDGLERLYGPPESQLAGLGLHLRRLSDELSRRVRLGYAPGKFAAWVVARAQPPGGSRIVAPADLAGFLARQPVDVLPVSPRMIQRLRRLGIARLDRLVTIPEPALVAQFGADGRRALAWATGARIDRVHPEPRERPVRVSIDFPAAIGQLDLLHAALDRLIRRALKRSRRHGKSVRGVRVGARLEDGGSWSIRAIVREPTSRADALGRFLRSRIALSPPPRAVEELRLEFFRFGPASTQAGLFDPREDAPRASGALETADGEILPAIRAAARALELRLGEGALYRVLEMQPGSRLPERRHALLEIA